MSYNYYKEQFDLIKRKLRKKELPRIFIVGDNARTNELSMNDKCCEGLINFISSMNTDGHRLVWEKYKIDTLKFYDRSDKWNSKDVNCEGGLVDMLTSMQRISPENFESNILDEELDKVAEELGYTKEFSLSKEDNVAYFSGIHQKSKAYILSTTSGIFFVFK